MNRVCLVLLCAIFLLAAIPCFGSIHPHNVAVVVNELSSASEAVGRYYCETAGIPLSNLIEVETYTTENISWEQFPNVAAAIRTALVTQLGVNPSDPTNDKIQVLVMCSGVPSTIDHPSGSEYPELRTSVDSYLTLLFNTDPDIGPDSITGLGNPYLGKDTDFATFRASTDNRIISGGNTYKMRYLCCRLSAYPSPTVEVQGYGVMPRDVKYLIDRAAASADQSGRFVLDEAWTSDGNPPYGHYYYSTAASTLPTFIDSSLVVRDGESSACYVNTFNDATGVLGYASFGMHDADIMYNTDWGRPKFNWKPGSVAVINESYGGAGSSAGTVVSFGSGAAVEITEPKLRVIATKTIGAYVKHLTNYRVRLLNWSGGELATALVDATGVAEIDLSSQLIEWPVDHKTKIQLYYPDDDDGYHDGEQLSYSTYLCSGQFGEYDLYQLKENGHGLSLTLSVYRQKTGDYIRDGCSGIGAAVAEPQADFIDADITLPRYAKGYSWAEAAYMGTRHLGYKAVVIGDALMSPLAAHPTVTFLAPAPAEGSKVNGTAGLAASVTPDGTGTIEKVEFRVTDGDEIDCLIATDSSAPYQCAWNCLEMSGGNRVYPDGDYTIKATAYQNTVHVGATTAARAVELDSTANLPVPEITQPEDPDSIVSDSVPVEATATGTPDKVQFWLFDEGNVILAAEDYSSPYQCTITSQIADDGVYELQAVACWDDPDSASYSARRRIVLVNDATPYTTVGALRDESHNESIVLASMPVVAGTGSTMDGAFYVEDPSRCTGIRVETTETVATGRLVTISGTLHKDTGDIERHIQASHIWDMGTATTPQALGLTNLNIGGHAPTGTPGITGGVGLYNTGLLVKTWGRVTYVGDDFVYIDDGSGRQDGNNIVGPVVVPLDGSPFRDSNGDPIHEVVKGIRIYLGSMAKPGIDDYVAVSGISSIVTIGSNQVPMLRVRNSSDVSPFEQFVNARTVSAGRLVKADDNTVLPVGSKVRLRDDSAYLGYGKLLAYEMDGLHFAADIVPYLAELQTDDIVTVNGTYEGLSSWSLALVSASNVYYGGSQFGAMSLSISSYSPGANDGLAGGGPFRPWPYPTAEEVLASSWFQEIYNRPGAIGWVLSQPDGTVLDLLGEEVIAASDGGSVLALKEAFEPYVNGGKLVLVLDKSVEDITGRMATIDIIGGTLTTLPSGQRAIVNPREVYAHVDKRGRYMMAMPWFKWLPGSDVSDYWRGDWPWKVRIAP